MSLDALRAETGLQFGYRGTGSLRVFRNEKGFEQARRRAAWLGQHGIPSKVLDAHEVVALEGALADIQDQLLGGMYYPDDSIGDAYVFCEQLAAHLSRQNVELRYGTLVRDFKGGDRRIQAVVTSDGDVSGDAFVLAAGVASQKLAKQAGIDLSVRPVKGYSISCPGVDMRNPRVPVIDDALHAVVTPLSGILRAAGTAEFSGQDLGIPVARVDNLRRLLQRIYPWANSSVPDAALRAWAGLRAVSADGVPIVGRTRLENLYVNTGHGHLGWSLAAGSASLLAQMMSQESSSVDTRPYDPGRFN
jgi:D-amino-acid dehydrogenase